MRRSNPYTDSEVNGEGTKEDVMAVSIAMNKAAAPEQATEQAADAPVATIGHGLQAGLERGAPLVVAFLGGLSLIEFNSGLGWLADFAIGALLLFALYHLLNGLVTLAWKLIRLAVWGVGTLIARRSDDPQAQERALAPYRFLSRVRGQTIGAVLAPLGIIFMDKVKFGDMSMISQPAVTESLIPFGVVACALAGVALAGGVGRKTKVVLLAVAALVVALPVAWYAWPGESGYLARPDTGAINALPVFAFENPGQTGPFAVGSLTYGSGAGRRAEYGRDAALLTPTVDATPAYAGWQGIGAGFYGWLFGGDFKHLPLNGSVWYPEGAGPFPLVLIVHGNHGATDYSDPGYAYLGEHFASRGFITVSVDENFLNGHSLWEGHGDEMPVRAWLLLKHLQVWRGWNADPGSPFYGKVDLERVVLMGHSRGGRGSSARGNAQQQDRQAAHESGARRRVRFRHSWRGGHRAARRPVQAERNASAGSSTSATCCSRAGTTRTCRRSWGCGSTTEPGSSRTPTRSRPWRTSTAPTTATSTPSGAAGITGRRRRCC